MKSTKLKKEGMRLIHDHCDNKERYDPQKWEEFLKNLQILDAKRVYITPPYSVTIRT